MNTIKSAAIFLLISIFISPAVAVGAESAGQTPAVHKADVEGIVNFSRIGDDTGFGGATEPEAMTSLKQKGFTTVINMRLASEDGVDVQAEREAAEAAGLEYIHLPFDSSSPAPGYFDQFLAAVGDEANPPVYIHCGSATRVAALWMSKRVLADGWSLDEAAAEAEQIAGKPESAVAFGKKYIEAQEE